MPLQAYYLGPEGNFRRGLTTEEIRDAYESRQGLLWVDITAATDTDRKLLEDGFCFHHLAVEDAVSEETHSPKIDDFGDYLFIIVHGINHVRESDIVETAELTIFLSGHFVVSIHSSPLYSVEAVRHLVEDDGRPMKRGAGLLTHALIDTLVDNVLPTIDKMNEVADELEEEAIRSPQQVTLDGIMKLKRSALRVHRVIAPQREVLNRLSRGEFQIIRREAQIFYRDIYDHLVRIEDLNQAIRDRADNALSIYMSSVANRQNETMRMLSIVATIFLPLMLLVGIYGMNFRNMPELEWPWAYFAVLVFIAIVIGVALWWFWARKWITWGLRKVTRIRLFAVDREKLIGYFDNVAKWPNLKEE